MRSRRGHHSFTARPTRALRLKQDRFACCRQLPQPRLREFRFFRSREEALRSLRLERPPLHRNPFSGYIPKARRAFVKRRAAQWERALRLRILYLPLLRFSSNPPPVKVSLSEPSSPTLSR